MCIGENKKNCKSECVIDSSAYLDISIPKLANEQLVVCLLSRDYLVLLFKDGLDIRQYKKLM